MTASVSEAERHLRDVVALTFRNGKLYTGADDGKIKVTKAIMYSKKLYLAYFSILKLQLKLLNLD